MCCSIFWGGLLHNMAVTSLVCSTPAATLSGRLTLGGATLSGIPRVIHRLSPGLSTVSTELSTSTVTQRDYPQDIHNVRTYISTGLGGGLWITAPHPVDNPVDDKCHNPQVIHKHRPWSGEYSTGYPQLVEIAVERRTAPGWYGRGRGGGTSILEPSRWQWGGVTMVTPRRRGLPPVAYVTLSVQW